MSSFSRTNSGLSNLSLFCQSDLIAYTEGGSKSYSLEEVFDGKYSKSSIDIKFWTCIFDALGCSKKITFRAIGSKNSGKQLTDKIVSGSIKNSIIIKDRDLDDFLNSIINHPNVIYTKGYSWENDVFQKEVTISSLHHLIDQQLSEEELLHVDNLYCDIENQLKKLIRLELFFRNHGVSFLTDLAGEAIINEKMEFSKDVVFNRLRIQSKGIPRPCKKSHFNREIDPYLDCYGKMISILAYRVICFYSKQYNSQKSMPKDLITKFFIQNYQTWLKSKNDEYYFEVVQTVNKI